ncbi:hypothetical protein D554_0853 [Bordetella holmesii 30539]|uniref:N-acetyltransferase YedL n=2 Tax=Bordetella holmesii TaxID=35814 RepID=A0ABN0S2P5_9BORD|nr:hypothetical protein F783_011895 [Bordetella holmesii F627]EXF89653.1 hypothetical protein D554_0853 [Bordetella holmesii 30539]EXX95861.1 hypothetical protein D559_3299 [Bordetella holmesii 1058]KAK70006.1 hypothetical protein L573_0002 [Bordetella holmesii H620]KAK79992.1 hypothetical protein L503_3046 [Bordetella holmesii CDC-H809-BH]KAK95717.1 hypothetical protein L497_3043 [Bordetella holmesii CDC-H585-BH]KAK95921.1 hypothetical protein L499_A3062 [Bordetella holmesii CDC-H635-BH]KCV
MDNYLNVGNSIFFKILDNFFAVQELCLARKPKLNKFLGTDQNPCLFNFGTHNVHNPPT